MSHKILFYSNAFQKPRNLKNITYLSELHRWKLVILMKFEVVVNVLNQFGFGLIPHWTSNALEKVF